MFELFWRLLQCADKILNTLLFLSYKAMASIRFQFSKYYYNRPSYIDTLNTFTAHQSGPDRSNVTSRIGICVHSFNVQLRIIVWFTVGQHQKILNNTIIFHVRIARIYFNNMRRNNNRKVRGKKASSQILIFFTGYRRL